MTRQQADKFIIVYEELGGNDNPNCQIGITRLYHIATMSEEHRDQSHTIPSSCEDKTPDEMTVKELREVKKALKDEKEAREQAEKFAEELAESNSDTYHNL